MPDNLMKDFIEEVTANKLKVDSIIISKGSEYREHFFKENKKRDGRSLSKLVTGLAIGIAVEKGLINPEDNIMDFFGHIEITNEKNRDHLANTKIKHLLSMTMGHDRPLMMWRDYKNLPEDTDYASYILNSDINYPPGTFFVYTNAVSYLLSAIMQGITGQTFDKWIRDNLLTPLEIEELYWEHSHQGICMGSTGLHVDVKDVHKIGMLLLNRGSYRPGGAAQPGKQIVSPDWIDTMTRIHILNQDWEKFHNPENTCIKKIAYGYHIWVCGDGSENYPDSHFFGDGAEGQQLIICPKEEMIIAIMARMSNAQVLEEIICKKLLAFLESK